MPALWHQYGEPLKVATWSWLKPYLSNPVWLHLKIFNVIKRSTLWEVKGLSFWIPLLICPQMDGNCQPRELMKAAWASRGKVGGGSWQAWRSWGQEGQIRALSPCSCEEWAWRGASRARCLRPGGSGWEIHSAPLSAHGAFRIRVGGVCTAPCLSLSEICGRDGGLDRVGPAPALVTLHSEPSD